ncbi:MAG: 2-oxoacid:acceptor oxidoreductase subunit alpha [Candidatus Micrarchaeota archaeon]
MRFTFRIGAQAGAGVMVTGRMLGRCFTRTGYNVLAYPEYPSLVRGGHNVYQVIIGDENVSSPDYKCDLLLALNKDAIFYHKDAMSEKGMIIYDKEIDATQFKVKEGITLLPLPINELLQKAGGTALMANALQIGAALAAIHYPLDVFEQVLRDEFGRKGEDVVTQNIAAAKAGYDYVKQNAKPVATVKPHGSKKQYLLLGNEAIALGAVKAGMKFYSAYPMTPSSGILHYLCENEREFGIIVKQTEDEIAAVNEAIGASYTGVRAATGSSGGGFALKTEAVSLAGMTETPLVVFLSQRPGPSTGLPTWTEQGDLRMALHSGQGDFIRVLLAPGDINEAYGMAAEAFNLAEKYQLPVILLSDKFLSESIFSTPELPEVRIDRGKIATKLKYLEPNTRFARYKLEKDGVSARVFPGTPNGMHVASSYEHDETGFSSELFSNRKLQSDKRMVKMKKLLKDLPLPEVFGDPNADVLLVTWGSMKMPAREAVERLAKAGKKVKLLQFSCVYPLDARRIKQLLKANHTIMIENNATGQFAGLLREACGWKPNFLMLKYTGRPFYAEEIADEVGKLMDSGFKSSRTIRVLDRENLEYYNPKKHGL